ncbi:hypothetical protein ANN_14630 [Periplaneta americana]|uniref:Uncharacterized protein n=1 Tax=Periplaneta americana TaxID=6978 RepID=A0ABQ8SXG9_PERAM|nr:hypothetical protein ANN_14630 [Periplaneta americana]
MTGLCEGGNEPSDFLKAINEVWPEDSPKDYLAFALWLGKTSEKPNQVIHSPNPVLNIQLNFRTHTLFDSTLHNTNTPPPGVKTSEDARTTAVLKMAPELKVVN